MALRRGVVSVVAVLCGAFLWSVAHAGPVDTVLPVTVKHTIPAGFRSIRYSLWDAETGGVEKWHEGDMPGDIYFKVPAKTFTANLGTKVPLDISLFEEQLWLQVEYYNTKKLIWVAGTAKTGDARTMLRIVPYAAHSLKTTEIVTSTFPSGSVMFFNLAACPTGWSELADARGRALVGVPASGSLGGTVGAPLGNLENRNHSHAVDPGAVASASGGDHLHSADPPSVNSSQTSHSHSVNPPNAYTSSYDHKHAWAHFENATKVWNTWDGNGGWLNLVDWGDGMDSAGSGTYPLAFDGSSRDLFTTNNTHNHTVDIGNFYSDSYVHGHSVDVGSFSTDSRGNHAHSVDVASTTSSSTNGLLSYMQLLICQKD